MVSLCLDRPNLGQRGWLLFFFGGGGVVVSSGDTSNCNYFEEQDCCGLWQWLHVSPN